MQYVKLYGPQTYKIEDKHNFNICDYFIYTSQNICFAQFYF